MQNQHSHQKTFVHLNKYSHSLVATENVLL